MLSFNKIIENVVVLHEYGIPRHFESLYRLHKEGKIGRIESIEFNIPKQFAKGIVYRDVGWIRTGFRNIRKLTKLLIKRGQIIIIGAAPYDAIVPLLLYLKRRNRVIYFTSWPYWDGERCPKRGFFSYQKKLWRNFIDGVMAVTVSQAAQVAISKLGANAIHIPHCVDTKIFRPRNVGSKNSTIRILFVGQMSYHKGADLFLDIVKDNLLKNVEYWFVGKGPFFNKLVELATKGYPIEAFGYVGNRSRLSEIYRNADIFVLSSRQSGNWEELFGIVLIEAMASGLPVIATNCVGPKEIVDNNQDGFLINQNSKSELVERIRGLIARPEKRKVMGKVGREKVLMEFDVAIISKKWESVLNSVTGDI